MWKRLIIRLASGYLEKLFKKWLNRQTNTQRERIIGLLSAFESYLREKRQKTATQIADLLIDWRE